MFAGQLLKDTIRVPSKTIGGESLKRISVLSRTSFCFGAFGIEILLSGIRILTLLSSLQFNLVRSCLRPKGYIFTLRPALYTVADDGDKISRIPSTTDRNGEDTLSKYK